jgi:hypothetical protein
MGKGRLLAWVLAFSALPSLAAAKKPVRVVPAIFDPNHTHAVRSDWLPFFGQHEPDEALLMFKLAATSVNASAGATVENVEGSVLDELGFDVFHGGHCGAGAPRFDVTTTDGSVYFFGCAYGIHTPASDRPILFTRVRFSDADAVRQLGSTPPWPGFGRVRVARIDIVFDEGTDVGSGFTALDDIDINGELIGSGHHDRGDDDRDRD